jgi:hypothetical protein
VDGAGAPQAPRVARRLTGMIKCRTRIKGLLLSFS